MIKHKAISFIIYRHPQNISWRSIVFPHFYVACCSPDHSANEGESNLNYIRCMMFCTFNNSVKILLK